MSGHQEKPHTHPTTQSRAAMKVFEDSSGQRPLSKRFLSSAARFIALPSIIDSLASPPPQGKIRPIETKCLMYAYALDLWSLQISLLAVYPWGGALAKESIIEGRAINLASLDKNLLLRGRWLSGKNLRRSSLQLWSVTI